MAHAQDKKEARKIRKATRRMETLLGKAARAAEEITLLATELGVPVSSPAFDEWETDVDDLISDLNDEADYYDDNDDVGIKCA